MSYDEGVEPVSPLTAAAELAHPDPETARWIRRSRRWSLAALGGATALWLTVLVAATHHDLGALAGLGLMAAFAVLSAALAVVHSTEVRAERAAPGGPVAGSLLATEVVAAVGFAAVSALWLLFV